MKKYLFSIFFFLSIGIMAIGQTSDQLISSCVMSAGANAKYLKDFRVQLGKTSNTTELRFKANMSLWKNTKYRFSLCNAGNSQGQLFLTIVDDTHKQILSSYDKSTGKSYPSVDFTCNKSGIYQLNFDFVNGQQGSGVGVVSMVK
jgi:hypothetical protein